MRVLWRWPLSFLLVCSLSLVISACTRLPSSVQPHIAYVACPAAQPSLNITPPSPGAFGPSHKMSQSPQTAFHNPMHNKLADSVPLSLSADRHITWYNKKNLCHACDNARLQYGSIRVQADDIWGYLTAMSPCLPSSPFPGAPIDPHAHHDRHKSQQSSNYAPSGNADRRPKMPLHTIIAQGHVRADHPAWTIQAHQLTYYLPNQKLQAQGPCLQLQLDHTHISADSMHHHISTGQGHALGNITFTHAKTLHVRCAAAWWAYASPQPQGPGKIQTYFSLYAQGPVIFAYTTPTGTTITGTCQHARYENTMNRIWLWGHVSLSAKNQQVKAPAITIDLKTQHILCMTEADTSDWIPPLNTHTLNTIKTGACPKKMVPKTCLPIGAAPYCQRTRALPSCDSKNFSSPSTSGVPRHTCQPRGVHVRFWPLGGTAIQTSSPRPRSTP